MPTDHKTEIETLKNKILAQTYTDMQYSMQRKLKRLNENANDRLVILEYHDEHPDDFACPVWLSNYDLCNYEEIKNEPAILERIATHFGALEETTKSVFDADKNIITIYLRPHRHPEILFYYKYELQSTDQCKIVTEKSTSTTSSVACELPSNEES